MTPLPIHELANIVPLANALEQQALNDQIATNGFLTSAGLITLYKGAIVDGRCRQIALLDLGLDPANYTTTLPDETTPDELREIVLALNTRRNLTTTQKVVASWNQTQLLKSKGRLNQEQSANKFGVSVAMVKHAGVINKYALLINSSLYSTNIYKVVKVATGSYSRILAPTNILQALFDGHFIKVGDEPATNSIKMVAKRLKELHESVELTIESAIADWDADAYITTEAGKRYYKGLVTTNLIPENAVGIRMALAELANFKFTIASEYTSPDTYEPSTIHGELL